MKTKAVLFGFLLVIIYTVLLESWKERPETIVSGQGQMSYNAINAQRFLYDFSDEHYNCILGTSLANVLQKEDLPPNFYNLAFAGQSVLDGLQILKFKKTLPDTLFVEINYLSKEIREEFVKRIASSKVEVEIKQKLLFLQERNVPIGLTVNRIAYLFNKNLSTVRNKYATVLHIAKNKIDEWTGNHPEDQYKELIEQTKKDRKKVMSVLPDKQERIKSFQHVVAQLRELEKKSVTIIFFEMPVDCSLENNARFRFNRDLVKKAFPPSSYRYIANGGCENYIGSDGLHLNPISANSFAFYFVSETRK